MGSNALRIILNSEGKWSDPDAPRHKHEFSVPALVVLERPNDKKDYFQTMKCKYCHSFRPISREGAVSGFINKPEDMQIEPETTLYFRINHKYIIGFKDMTFLKEK